VSWKLSRTVLRGGTNSNVGSPTRLGNRSKKETALQHCWAIGPKKKQPFSIGMVDDRVFAFAGLWERWRDPSGELMETCTILTTKPNTLVADVHDRMPVILSAADYDLRLDPGITNPECVVDCLKPFDARLMKKYPVSTRVNRPENDDQECAQEVPVGTGQTLF
jgi:putative SOS response-associated peptidase YedK